MLSSSEPNRLSNRSATAMTPHAEERADGRIPSPGSPPPPQMAQRQMHSRAESIARSEQPPCVFRPAHAIG